MRTTPLLWLALCVEEWGCTRSLAERTWQSLRASRWTRPTTLRQFLLAQPFVNVAHFRQRYTPQTLLEALEDLVREHQLSRSSCTRLEATILRQVQANGCWRAPEIPTLAKTGQPS